MDITAVFKAVLTPDKDRSAENYAPFKPGDKVVGTVLRLEADGRALIDLGCFRALAQTTIPVQVGQKLPLTVIQTGTPTHLKLEAQSSSKSELPLPRMALSTLISNDELGQVIKSIDRLLTAKAAGQASAAATIANIVSSSVATQTGTSSIPLANTAKGHWPESVQHALHNLRSALTPMSSQTAIDQQAQWVQSTVEDRGILFELRLADVLKKSEPHALFEQGQSKTATGSSNIQYPGVVKEDNTTSGMNRPAVPGVQSDSADNRSSLGLEPTGIKESFGQLSAGTNPLASPAATDNNSMEDTGEFAFATQKSLDGSLEKAAAAVKAMGASVTAPVSESIDPTDLERVRQILSNDLKPQLLILKGFLDQATDHPDVSKEVDVKDLSILRQVVHQLLSHVEQQQAQAVRRMGEPDLYQVFTHLLPFKDQAAPIRLKIYYPKKGRAAENDPQHRIALLLDMDQLGLVRADLHMVDQQLRIQFYVQDDTVQQMFVQHAHTVAEVLEGQGYFETVAIDTRVSIEKIQRFEGEDLAGPPLGRIDVTV